MQYRHDFDKVVSRIDTDSGKWNMHPRELLPMWVADTDFTCPKEILDALKERMEHGIFGYPIVRSSYGKAVQHWYQTRYGVSIDSGAVLYIPTILLGMMECLFAFTAEGDEVLVFSPQYSAFFEAIENTDRKKVISSLIETNGQYCIDFQDLEEKLSRSTLKLLFLCNPHNPTGRVWTFEELEKISGLCLKYGVLLVSDDIYSDYVFAPHTYIPVCSISENVRNNSVILQNPSKTFNTPGLRAAAVIIHNKELREKLYALLRRKKTAEPNIMGMAAFEVAYTKCAWYADELLDYVEKNLDYAVSYIERNMPLFSAVKPQGTFLLWLDCRKLGWSQEELDKFMLEKAHVLLNSGNTYGEEGTGFFRMNVAVPRIVLQECLERIHKAYCKCFS